MTKRWELVELIGQTLLDQESNVMTEDTCEAILDAIEDLIRANEREQTDRAHRRTAQWARETMLADLLAKVLTLPTVGGVTMPYVKGAEHQYEMVYRADVLALFGGSNVG